MYFGTTGYAFWDKVNHELLEAVLSKSLI